MVHTTQSTLPSDREVEYQVPFVSKSLMYILLIMLYSRGTISHRPSHSDARRGGHNQDELNFLHSVYSSLIVLDTKSRKIHAGYKYAAVKKYVSEKPFFFNTVCRHIYRMQNIPTQWEHISFFFVGRILICI